MHLVLGPWNHGQGRREGRGIGRSSSRATPPRWFRRTVMQPFLDHYLKDGPKPGTPRVLVYETGANEWHRYDDWPRACAAGCAANSRDPVSCCAGGRLGFEAPAEAQAATTTNTSPIPAKPVPYRAAADAATAATPENTWGEWLVDDQRNAASRTDVLVYETEPLTEPLRLAGEPIGASVRVDERQRRGLGREDHRRVADRSTRTTRSSAATSRWSRPTSCAAATARISRSRSRSSRTRCSQYRIRLPHASHTFLPGHRIMVQIQSSWFPLYDRNPQTFVPNIMFAKPRELREGDAPRLAHGGAGIRDRAAGDPVAGCIRSGAGKGHPCG